MQMQETVFKSNSGRLTKDEFQISLHAIVVAHWSKIMIFLINQHSVLTEDLSSDFHLIFLLALNLHHPLCALVSFYIY